MSRHPRRRAANGTYAKEPKPKDACITIRVAREEKARLIEDADHAGATISEYLMRLVLRERVSRQMRSIKIVVAEPHRRIIGVGA